jgi:hypothetical protein
MEPPAREGKRAGGRREDGRKELPALPGGLEADGQTALLLCAARLAGGWQTPPSARASRHAVRRRLKAVCVPACLPACLPAWLYEEERG